MSDAVPLEAAPALSPSEAREQLATHKAHGTLDTSRHAYLYQALHAQGADAAAADPPFVPAKHPVTRALQADIAEGILEQLRAKGKRVLALAEGRARPAS
jgi:hypothetical protein